MSFLHTIVTQLRWVKNVMIYMWSMEFSTKH